MLEYDHGHVAPILELGDPVREAAQRFEAALRQSGQDPTLCAQEVVSALTPLINRHQELFAASAQRPSQIPGHLMSTIYFDPSLMIQVVGAPGGFRLPAHNHSAWNILFVCEGEMQFRWYQRLDDRSVPGRADLRVADDRVLRSGDAGIVAPPPNDIHELEVLSDYLWMVVVTPEPEAPVREIYLPEAGTYEIKGLAPIPPLLASI